MARTEELSTSVISSAGYKSLKQQLQDAQRRLKTNERLLRKLKVGRVKLLDLPGDVARLEREHLILSTRINSALTTLDGRHRSKSPSLGQTNRPGKTVRECIKLVLSRNPREEFRLAELRREIEKLRVRKRFSSTGKPLMACISAALEKMSNIRDRGRGRDRRIQWRSSSAKASSIKKCAEHSSRRLNSKNRRKKSKRQN